MELVLATYQGSPLPTPSDRVLAGALEGLGARVSARPWDTIDPTDESISLVCLRSTWDYHLRIAEFQAWVSAFRSTPERFWNPPDSVLWNLDKKYLRGLELLGIAIPNTRWLPEGKPLDLRGQFRATGWRRAVLKPRISASAHGTMLVTPDSVLTREDQATLSATGALLQEFVPEVQTRGEISLIFLGGEYSHAVCKETAAGEFRVQPHHGGVAGLVDASPDLQAFGERVLATVPPPWVYARVDVVAADRGPLLMEVELIEPELFFNLAPEGADRLARQLLRLVGRNSSR